MIKKKTRKIEGSVRSVKETGKEAAEGWYNSEE